LWIIVSKKLNVIVTLLKGNDFPVQIFSRVVVGAIPTPYVGMWDSNVGLGKFEKKLTLRLGGDIHNSIELLVLDLVVILLKWSGLWNQNTA